VSGELQLKFTSAFKGKYTWISPDGKTHKQIDVMLIDTRWHSKYTLCTVIQGSRLWYWSLSDGCKSYGKNGSI